MKQYKFKVLNKDWTAKFLKTKAFYKTFEEDCTASAEIEDRIVWFNLDKFNEEVVRHELTHAYLEEMAYNSLTLDKEQNEEFTCELVGKHGRDLVEIGLSIFNHVKGVT